MANSTKHIFGGREGRVALRTHDDHLPQTEKEAIGRQATLDRIATPPRRINGQFGRVAETINRQEMVGLNGRTMGLSNLVAILQETAKKAQK